MSQGHQTWSLGTSSAQYTLPMPPPTVIVECGLCVWPFSGLLHHKEPFFSGTLSFLSSRDVWTHVAFLI